MNYFDLISSYPDPTITAAWDSQVREAAQTPGLAEILLSRGSELFPRFAACYAELRALPRSARRAVQRKIVRSHELAAIFPEWLQSGGGRALQLKLARSLAGAALLLALGQGMATATTITVTTDNPRIRADGQCSLIEAIVNANADAATHADCPAGSGPDTIVLPTNAKVRLTNSNDNTYPLGLPLITSPITIDGNNAKIVRSAAASPFGGLLAVNKTGDLTLKNVTLTGGYGGNGGGVSNYGGTLTIQKSTISGNNAGGNGGGVSNNGRWVLIANSTISKNGLKTGPYCFYYYGVNCYYLYPGTVTITDSTISGNSAQWRGGGVANYLGTVTIENSTISGNKGGWAGGAYNSGGGFSDYYGKYIPTGSLRIVNSTISKNSAPGDSYYGTFFGGNGGGVVNWKGTLAIENSTISGNMANDQGGGLWISGYGTLNLKRNLISGNRAGFGREISHFGTVTADNFNLFGANGNAGVKGFTPGLTDIVPARGVGVGKILERLKDNGGPTKTRALKPGSPALDVIPFTDASCAGKDQRGVNRPQGTGCDIGAFERDGP